MAFIEKADFPATIHTEILNALTQGQDAVIDENVKRTIDEISAYLNGRYDTVNIFNKTGNARSMYVVRIAVTISTYYIFLAHNPRRMTEAMKYEFERAIDTLEKIQAGKISPVGLPTPAESDPPATSGDGAPIQYGSMNQLTQDY